MNACNRGTAGCTQICNNTLGSYICSCNSGYTLNADNHTCNGEGHITEFLSFILVNVDINECIRGTAGCTQICNNTLGSYICSCNSGYTLDADNHTCNGEGHS